jgi:hypothetical protein
LANTPQPIAPGSDPDLAPGGGEPSSPVPAILGDTGRDIAPPGISPEPDGTTPEPDPDLVPPDPDTGSITPAPEQDGVTPGPEACAYSMQAAPSSLLFTGGITTQTVVLTGDGCGEPLAFRAQRGAGWIRVMPSADSIPAGGSTTLVITVGRDPNGTTTGRVQVASAAGILDIDVEVEWPTPTPTTGSFRQPSISPTPTPRGPGGFTF